VTPDRRDRLLALITEQPDATLAELRDRLGGAGQRVAVQDRLHLLEPPCLRVKVPLAPFRT
jgi:hypothetical protein